MLVEIDLSKGARENADRYYAIAKKAKRKLEGLGKGVAMLQRKISEEERGSRQQKKLVRKRQRQWFEKFHWFFTSEGFLVIGGRDAKGNEAIVKKHMEKGDFYFHADIHGAPHVVLKASGEKPGENSIREAAVFAAVFSRAWGSGIPAVDVYSVAPEQVSKQAPSGESIGTGAFMIIGRRQWLRKTPLELAIGLRRAGESYEVFSGPPDAVGARADFSVRVLQGTEQKGGFAKKILGLFRSKAPDFGISVDDILGLLPAGGFSL